MNVSRTRFLLSHLDYFQNNCWDLKEKRGESFHQDIRIMEESYLGWWDVNFRANYCWCLKRDVGAGKHRRKLLKSPFIHK